MLKLYVTTDGDNVINKTLQFKKEYPIKFKEQTSITSPTITLKIEKTFNIMGCNYCYVSEFNRYYFIQDIQVISNDMYRLTLDCDVLESFKDESLNSECVYSRIISNGDFMNFSPNTDVRKTVSTYSNDIELTKSKNIILSTIGGV